MGPRAAAAAVGLILLVQGGCGGSHQSIDADGAHLLQAEVRSARDAAANGDFAAARSSLSTVQATVAALRRDDKISAARAADVLRAIGAVDGALRSIDATTSVSSTTSSSVPPATVAPPAPRKEHGKGGEKKGKDD